jgi:hypothetical protein
MLSLEDLCIQGLIHDCTRKHRDTTQLIKWLREGRKVTPELSLLIADVLEGKVKAYPKPSKKETKQGCRVLAKAFFNYYQEILGDPARMQGEWGVTVAAEELARAGHRGIPESKGEISLAAKHLTAHIRGLTLAQFDELLYPRKSREK